MQATALHAVGIQSSTSVFYCFRFSTAPQRAHRDGEGAFTERTVFRDLGERAHSRFSNVIDFAFPTGQLFWETGDEFKGEAFCFRFECTRLRSQHGNMPGGQRSTIHSVGDLVCVGIFDCFEFTNISLKCHIRYSHCGRRSAGRQTAYITGHVHSNLTVCLTCF